MKGQSRIVSCRELQRFAERACLAVDMPEHDAGLLAKLLIENDLRGNFTHGTQQLPGYLRAMRNGSLNPRPDVRICAETDTSTIYDGDGGLGYFPAYRATQATIAKAKQRGIAIGQSRNHGHFGAAGIYTRLMLGHDLLGFVTSGHQLHLEEAAPYVSAPGGSPYALISPAGQESELNLDTGAMQGIYPRSPHREAISRLSPSIVFRSVGMGAIAQSWGGFLAGIPVHASRASRAWKGADQGSLIIAFRIDLFVSPTWFKAEMDEYVRAVGKLEPLEGHERSFLPGGVEAQRERDASERGICLDAVHLTRLASIARQLSVPTPWEAQESGQR